MQPQRQHSEFIPRESAPVSSTGTNSALPPANQNSGNELKQTIETEVRACTSASELHGLIANQTRRLFNARQIFVMSGKTAMRMVAISNLPKVDRNAPLVHELEQTITFLASTEGLESARDFVIPKSSQNTQSELEAYPFKNLLWIPFLARNQTVLGGMLLANESPWNADEIRALNNLSKVYSYSLEFLSNENSKSSVLAKSNIFSKKTLLIGATLIGLLGFIPVPMTTLAPFEITSKNPYTVAASFDGVVEEIFVVSGERVKQGEPIVRFSDTELQNKLNIAQKEVQLAEARVKRANQLAFSTEEGRKELGTAKAELLVQKAELKLARELSREAIVVAPVDGVAVLGDEQKLIGKPVNIGHRILQIADPSELIARISLPVKDAIALETGSIVKLFPDGSPLSSKDARIENIDYKASETDAGQLAYRITANLSEHDDTISRLGVRGTARMSGDSVPLFVFLFRRPISSMRQWIGL